MRKPGPRRARTSERRRARTPPPAAPAKLTRPRLHDAYARERLFRLLDADRARPVVWIAGPPGAGKTTLAATWLEARRIAGIWYHLDPGDSDPATFFYYLRQAARPAAKGRGAPLPLLTAEYLADVPGFARRWFRELLRRLPLGAVIALDNYHELARDSGVHGALAAACEEIPGAAQLLVLSRVDPPPELSTALAREQLVRIHPEALKLTVEEAQAIGARKGSLTAEQAAEVHRRCGGWAAGFTLMRERTRRTGLVNRTDLPATMQEVFDYFMSLTLRDLDAQDRETLVKTAFLPRFTEAMAAEMGGSAGAGALLESLHRRHLFVERRYGTDVHYEYHALFRAFLLDQARRWYRPLGIAELSRRAAALLERAGYAEDAVQLLRESGEHATAARVLEELAPGLVAAGRGIALKEGVDALPAAEVDARPWLSYCLGTATIGVKLGAARSAFERAYAGFARDGDRTGQAMAVVGVLQTCVLAMDHPSSIEPWIPLLEPLFAEEPAFPSADVAARTYGTLVGLMLWAIPAHPLLPRCVERLEALLRQPLGPEVRVTAGGQLAEYYGMSGFSREADRIVAALAPATREPIVSVLARTFWNIRTFRGDYLAGRFETVRRKIDEAVELATRNGLEVGHGLAYGARVDLALDLGDPAPVPAIIEKMRAWVGIPGNGRQATARLRWMEAKLAVARGDLGEALRRSEQACAVPGFALPQLVYGQTLASVCVARGELDRARAVLASLPRFPRDRFPLQEFRVRAAEATVAAAAGDATEWRATLRQGLRRMQELDVQIPIPSQPLEARQVAELALAHGIEAPYVRAWVRTMKLRPSCPDAIGWPWAVVVRTLGTFSVEIDGVPLTFPRKAPRKPLELLQALVAFGSGAVAPETLWDALWPDSDGDAADAALRMTLSRLRRLLGQDAVALQHGKLSLDEGRCWVDAWSFERLRSRLERAGDAASAPSVLDLYRGEFLAHERDAAWMLPRRDGLRRGFVAAAVRVGEALERERGRDAAVAFYRQALERDPGCEAIQLRLDGASRALGRG